MTLSGPEPKVTARLATADDLPALESNETERTQGLSASYLERHAKGDFYVVVGLLDDQIMGRVILDCRDDPGVLVPEMKLLWVVPTARRRGLALAMTTFLEELAASLGYDEIFLGVTTDNPAAIPMYISLDYSPTGEHKFTTYHYIDEAGNTHSREEMDAIYRKSLRLLH